MNNIKASLTSISKTNWNITDASLTPRWASTEMFFLLGGNGGGRLLTSWTFRALIRS